MGIKQSQSTKTTANKTLNIMDAQNKLRIRRNIAEKIKFIAKRKRKTSTDLIHSILENFADEYIEKYLTKDNDNAR
ncbi:MAG: hypothetical protein HC836_31090 [Richelia sp. RM2_1_2]|nr:hypothetical protein [Richelia sp. SL_2_1]NJO62514.1 hypothetical protein [Richelia sp. RM2_1_2]